MRIDEKLCAAYLLERPAFWAQAAQALAEAEQGAAPLFAAARDRLVARRDTAAAEPSCRAMLALPQGGMVLAGFLGACLPDVLARLQKEGVPDTILRDTFRDFAVWEDWYYQKEGRHGIAELPWVLYPYAGRVYRVGRLMYEPAVFPHAVSFYTDAGGRLLAAPTAAEAARLAADGLVRAGGQGDAAISVHIPAGEPFTPALVTASLAAAARFFAAQGVTAAFAFCDSWMLDPALDAICRPGANLTAFAHRFARYPIREGSMIGKYVFGPTFTGDYTAVCPQGRFPRAVRDYALAGGTFCDTGGAMCWDAPDGSACGSKQE